MGIVPQNLLNLARELVDRNPGAPIEEDLRRGVSTAYYALFHLLVQEAMVRIVADVALRPRVARSLQHDKMKNVCQEYADAKVDPDTGLLTTKAGHVITTQLFDVSLAFVTLQSARHEADYHAGTTVTHAQADTHVMTAEAAFIDWPGILPTPSTGVFLSELFLRSVVRR
jgi:hypothetical protein